MRIKRKIKKFKNNPKLFLFDMKKNLDRKFKILKMRNNLEISVICHVADDDLMYLKDCLYSITNQSVKCKKMNIMIIDKTHSSCAQEEFNQHKNQNIYLCPNQEFLLNNVLKWCVSIQASDVLDYFFMENFGKEVVNNPDALLINCYKKIVSNKYVTEDKHPLKSMFNHKYKLSKLDFENTFMPSAWGMGFKNDILSKINKLDFFCDYHEVTFIFNCINCLDDDDLIIYSKETVYAFRKQYEDFSLYKKNKNSFLDALTIDFFPYLKDFAIDNFVQRVYLYYISELFHAEINNIDSNNVEFIPAFSKIFPDFKEDNILSFTWNRFYIHYRLAILEKFMGIPNAVNNVYLEKYDKYKNEILVSFFSVNGSSVSVFSGENLLLERIHKIVSYELFGSDLIYEHRCWIPLKQFKDSLNVKINGRPSNIFFKKKKYIHIQQSVLKNTVFQKSNDAWLFMDRIDQADDNAEHLYKYIVKRNPTQNCIFAIKKNSADWHRLMKEGVNLIAYGSKEFEEYLRGCETIISSHCHLLNYFPGKQLKQGFILLQHGVMHNDHTFFYNTKPAIKCFVISTLLEKELLEGNKSHYKLTEKECVLTGMPRHDALLEGNSYKNKTFVIMPTWRRDLTTLINDEKMLLQTEYISRWKSFFNNPRLKQLIEEYSYNVIYIPHAEIIKSVHLLSIPEYIKIISQNDCSIQNVFKESQFMITDYSSVAFEMAFLNKEVIYYQFDKDDFYQNHYKRGSFDHVEDGFGPQVITESDLLSEVKRLCERNGRVEDKYAQRIKKTFKYHDNKNCERVYQAILDLEKPSESEDINLNILEEFAQRAIEKNDDLVAISRCELLLEKGNELQRVWAKNNLLRLYFNNLNFENLSRLMNDINSNDVEMKRIKGKLVALKKSWDKVDKAISELRL